MHYSACVHVGTIMEEPKVKFNSNGKGLRGFLLAGTVIAGLAATPVFAQDTKPEDKEKKNAETVVITGSRIAKKDYTAISPVTTVTGETLQMTATNSVEKFLNELPQVVPGNTVTSNNAGGEDFATVDLRGLSPTRTLVLVNGDRVPASSTTGVVDINTIPAGLIDRVEVVTGGASAVYGSDAIAGVVNFIMKDNYEGAEVNFSTGANVNGKAREVTANFLVGGNFDNGKGNATLYADYYNRAGVFQSEFDWSKMSAAALIEVNGTTDEYVGKGCIANSSAEYIACNAAVAARGNYNELWLPGGSGTPAWGWITNSASNPFKNLATNPATAATFASADTDCNPATAGVAVNSGNLSFNANGKLEPRKTGGACAVPDRAAGSSRYNYAPDNYIIIPAERHVISANSVYNINDNLKLRTSVSYVNSSTTVQLASTPATGLSVTLTPAMQALIQSKHADLWAALQSRTNPLANFTIDRRVNELGFRIGHNENSTLLGMATLSGKTGISNWDWNVSASFGKSRFSTYAENSLNKTAMFQGLAGCQNPDGSAITGKLPGCVAVDIFGANTMDAAMVNFLSVDTQTFTDVEESRLTANLSGDLFELPAGAVAAVVGFEYRDSDANSVVDDAMVHGDIYGFNAVQNQKGNIGVTEFYGEASIPVLKDKPFAKYLGFEIGGRFSNYSTVGNVTTYKAGAEYSPVSWVKFRGMYNEATRAPNVFELFQNGDQGFPQFTDPCNATIGRTAATAAFCVAQGVPSAAISTFTQNNSQVEAYAFGNPDLKPETSKSTTLGLVFRPDWFPVGKLSATVDYYKISVADAVADRGATTIIRSCYTGLDANNPDCARIKRDVNTGQMVSVNTSRGNLASFNLQGYDIGAEWSNTIYGGRFRLQEVLSLVNKYEQNGFNYVGYTDASVGGSTPDYKSVLTATYKKGDWSFLTRWTYTPPMTEIDFEGVVPKTPAASYFDASARYDFSNKLQATVVVTNLLDKDPPQTFNGLLSQANTDPQVYRMLGRTYNVSLRYRF